MENFYLCALQHLKQLRSFIPLQPDSKDPYFKLLPRNSQGYATWAPYMESRPTLAEVNRWSHESGDIAYLGMVTGEISNVFAVDIDFRNGGEETWHELSGGREIDTETVKSGDGLHLIFRYPGHPIKLKEKLPGCELKSDGACLMRPPSLHPSGAQYRFIREVAPSDPPPFLQELLIPDLPRVEPIPIPPTQSALSIGDALQVFKRCEERRWKYPSTSEYDYAVVVTLVNRQCSFDVLQHAFRASLKHDTHYRKVLFGKREYRANRYLYRMYNKALTQDGTQRRRQWFCHANYLRNFIRDARWSATSGRTDRAIMLAHLWKMEMAQELDETDSFIWDVSVRELAETACCAANTASRATHRLLDAEWIEVSKPADHLRVQSAQYRLGRQLRETLSHALESHSSPSFYSSKSSLTSSAHSSCSSTSYLFSSELMCPPAHNLPGQTNTSGVFEFKGLGKAAELIWIEIQNGHDTRKKLREKEVAHRTTIDRRVDQMVKLSILFERYGVLTINEDYDYLRCAQTLGTAQTAQLRKITHANQRDSNQERLIQNQAAQMRRRRVTE